MTVPSGVARSVCLLIFRVDEIGEYKGAVLITDNNRLDRSCGGVGEEDASIIVSGIEEAKGGSVMNIRL